MATELPKRRRGPKPRPPEELRVHSVSCRLTDDELAALDERRGEVSRGEWLRLAALSKPPRIVPTLNATAWSELSRTASNLNQLAKALNEGRWAVDDRRAAIKSLTALSQQLASVRAALLGQDDRGDA